jgi:hypothetical protein
MQGLVVFAFAGAPILLGAAVAMARPAVQVHEIAAPEVEQDLVGDVDGTQPASQKALQDTVWIADWTFDAGAACDETGWIHADNHILNDGSNDWHIETGFTTPAGIAGMSAAVGYHDNVCCAGPDGYANDWYQAIRITYTGAATISLDYIVDTETGFDFLQVETDSACASFGRVDFDVNPKGNAATFRRVEVQADGLVTNGEWNDVTLSDHGPGIHCAYVVFFADGGFSPCDGNQPSMVGEGAVVDNIVVTDAAGTRTEDFEDGTLDIGTTATTSSSGTPS